MGRTSDNERRWRTFELYECFLVVSCKLTDKTQTVAGERHIDGRQQLF